MKDSADLAQNEFYYILKTKLFIPSIRKKRVERPRLQQQMRHSLNYRLILLSAPAGYGKSTLIASWARTCPYPIAWLSLDANDNDLARYTKYVSTAIQGALQKTAIQQEIHRQVSYHSLTTTSIKDYFSILLNQLCELEDPFFLVMDDYQFIISKEVHDMTAFLIEKMPENVHVIIATRIDPPFPLARMRTSEQVLEIRTRNIQFTRDEINDYYKDVMGMQLSQEDLAILEGCTEGWAAGLQMAALAMQSLDIYNSFLRKQFLHSFQGSQRYIMDYLLEEVLNNQSPEVRRFLLITSILDRLTASLCDAVLAEGEEQEVNTDAPTGSQSASMLAYLERANIFLVPLDDKRIWYRYHHLFADLLQFQLQVALGTQGVARLHLLASVWYEHNGLTLDAIHAASLAGDLDRVECLIERNYFELMSSGEMNSMALWTQKISKELLYMRPKLCIYEAMSRLWFGQLDEANFLLSEAEKRIGAHLTEPDTVSVAFLTYVQSRFAAMKGDLRRAIALNLDARQKTPAGDQGMQLTMGITLGMEYFLYGDFDHAITTFQEIVEHAYTCNNISDGVAAYALLGRLYAVQGKLQTAREMLQMAVLWLNETGNRLQGARGLVNIGLAAVLCERNDLEEALTFAEKGLELVPLWGKVDDLVLGYFVLARILTAQEKWVAAGEVVDKANQLIQVCSVFSEAHALAEIAQVRRWLNKGDFQSANQWAAAFDGKVVDSEDPFQFQVELSRMTRVRVFMTQNQLNEAIVLLCSLEEIARAHGRMGRVIEILILQALVLDRMGDFEQANSALTQSLQLAAPEGYLRIFLDEGQSLRKLLSKWLGHNAGSPLSDYAFRLLSQFDYGPEDKQKKISQIQSLHEPLSQRELEVLRYVALGRTNQEIARQLIVSTGTIKAHAASIYRKLDVNNRTEAVAHARELGLLP
jgi:LuxR family transcriptional regulator, maltose regulon positive regulatory protein